MPRRLKIAVSVIFSLVELGRGGEMEIEVAVVDVLPVPIQAGSAKGQDGRCPEPGVQVVLGGHGVAARTVFIDVGW